MALDHYVSQVHLRQFCHPDENGQLFVVNKTDLREFSPNPRNICAVHGGNSNIHLTDPDILEKLFAIFEPEYPRALRDLRKRKKGYVAREVISAFISAVNLAAPTFKLILQQPTENLLAEEARRLNGVGQFPPFPFIGNPDYDGKSFADLLDSGKIQIDIDMSMPQAIASTRIPNIVAAFSGADWDVLHFSKENALLTSDFPLALLENNKYGHLSRFIPLAPDIGIVVHTVKVGVKMTRPLQAHYDVTSNSKISTLNRCIIKSAGNHVISKGRPDWLKDLVTKYRAYRLVIDPLTKTLAYTNQ